ncbi:MAG: hypothetical protein FJX53_00390 [Alphaproteobacteria bacterium]|nr:hypothetical protein [Alphaproteobacteria bacterium]
MDGAHALDRRQLPQAARPADPARDLGIVGLRVRIDLRPHSLPFRDAAEIAVENLAPTDDVHIGVVLDEFRLAGGSRLGLRLGDGQHGQQRKGNTNRREHPAERHRISSTGLG